MEGRTDGHARASCGTGSEGELELDGGVGGCGRSKRSRSSRNSPHGIFRPHDPAMWSRATQQQTQPQPLSSVSKGGCASTVVERKGRRSIQFGRYCLFVATCTARCAGRQLGDKYDSARCAGRQLGDSVATCTARCVGRQLGQSRWMCFHGRGQKMRARVISVGVRGVHSHAYNTVVWPCIRGRGAGDNRCG